MRMLRSWHKHAGHPNYLGRKPRVTELFINVGGIAKLAVSSEICWMPVQAAMYSG